MLRRTETPEAVRQSSLGIPVGGHARTYVDSLESAHIKEASSPETGEESFKKRIPVTASERLGAAVVPAG